MEEVSGPIIAIALVLCAVFVPMAFVSGLTGQFYRQFALTIAFSTVISAFNSLTLSPALARSCSSPHGRRADRLDPGDRSAASAGSSVPSTACSTAGSERYGRTAWLASSCAGGRGARRLRRPASDSPCSGSAKVPHGFVPTQDKQYLVAFAQLPDAATLDRTEAVIRRMSDIGLKQPGVHERGAVPRACRSTASSTRPTPASCSSPLKPFEERRSEGRSTALNIAGALNAEVRRDPGRVRRGLPAAAGAGTRHGRRLQAVGRGPRRARRVEELYDATAGAAREGLADPGAGRSVLELPGQRAAAGRGRRPRAR